MISIPYGPAFVSVVTDTKDEIIIKAVNFAEEKLVLNIK